MGRGPVVVGELPVGLLQTGPQGGVDGVEAGPRARAEALGAVVGVDAQEPLDAEDRLARPLPQASALGLALAGQRGGSSNRREEDRQ